MRRVAALAFVAVAGVLLVGAPAEAGGGCHDPANTEGAGTTVRLADLCFGPTVLRTDPGQVVTWSNDDTSAHVVFGVGWGTLDEIGPGESVEWRFDRPGTYAYSCYLHPGMNGAVIVGDGTSSGSTVGGVVAGGSGPAGSPGPAAEAPRGASAGSVAASVNLSSEPAGVSPAWRVVALIAIGLLLCTVGLVVARWWGGRRARVAEVTMA